MRKLGESCRSNWKSDRKADAHEYSKLLRIYSFVNLSWLLMARKCKPFTFVESSREWDHLHCSKSLGQLDLIPLVRRAIKKMVQLFLRDWCWTCFISPTVSMQSCSVLTRQRSCSIRIIRTRSECPKWPIVSKCLNSLFFSFKSTPNTHTDRQTHPYTQIYTQTYTHFDR